MSKCIWFRLIDSNLERKNKLAEGKLKPEFVYSKLTPSDRAAVHTSMVGLLVEKGYREGNDFEVMDLVREVVKTLALHHKDFATVKKDHVRKTYPLIADIYSYISNAKRNKEKLEKAVIAAKVATEGFSDGNHVTPEK